MARPPDPLIARYKALIARYGDRTASSMVRAWDRLGSYSEDDIARYQRQTAPVLSGAKTAAVAASAAFFVTTHRIKPVVVKIDHVVVKAKFADPFHAMWHAVGEGRPNDEALQVGRSVAEATGNDFVVSAARRASDLAAKAAGIRVRWARVPAGDACAFYIDAAADTYATADSADFGHDRCSCAVVPT